MPFTQRQFKIHAKESGQNKYANLTVNFPDSDFTVLIDGALIQTKIEGEAVVYELLDPGDVVLELVVRSKSAGKKRTGAKSLAIVAPKTGGESALKSAAQNEESAVDAARHSKAKKETKDGDAVVSMSPLCLAIQLTYQDYLTYLLLKYLCTGK